MKTLRISPFLAFIALTLSTAGRLHAAEGRIPISDPTSITAPGSYIVTEDITATTSVHAIRILADDVTIDLDGHTVAGTVTGYWAIYADGYTDIRIINGNARGISGGIFLRKPKGSFHVEGMNISAGALSGNGIEVAGDATDSAYAVIKNNIITGLGQQIGIQFYYTRGMIEGNKCAKWGTGVRLWFSSNVLVEGNIAAENANNGIQLYEAAAYNVIKSNSVSQNGFAGIGMFRADYNTVAFNTVSGNTSYGIFLYSATNSADFNSIQGNSTSCSVGTGLSINGCGNIYTNNKAPGACGITVNSGCTGGTPANINGGGNVP